MPLNNITAASSRTFLLLAAWCFLAHGLLAQEICDNGIDDDGNGLIDLNDTTGCPCTLAPPRPNLIPNGSFEEHTCCPPATEYIQCATGWMDYMTFATLEYFNTCGYFPPIVPRPLPNGQAAVGISVFTDHSHTTSYYEFLTRCLPVPLNTGQPYKLAFNMAAARIRNGLFMTVPIDFGPIDMAIFGYTSCPTQPYVAPMGTGATICPTTWGWTELGRVTYTPTNTWQEVSFDFTPPFDVQAIMFGPACPVPADYLSRDGTQPYLFVDDMALKPLSLDIEHTGHPCTHDLQLTAIPYDPANSRYQWYLDGVAIVGQTGEKLQASSLGLGQGIYTVRSIANNGDCLLASDTLLVKYPKPLLSATPQQGCAPLAVTLSNATDPALTAHLAWGLGDGTTDTTSVVTHTYRTAGTYSVRLSVTSPEGCTKDSLFQDLITVHPRPIAAFSADTTSGCVGLVVQFSNATASPDAFTSAWDFGDGTSSTDQDPQHTYTAPGNYDVRLTVTSAFGCSDDTLMAQLITILPTPEPAFIAEPASGCIPLAVRFNNQTPGQALQNPTWDLGNGQTSTDASPSTTYTLPGHYTVTLTMRNALGCSASLVQTDAVVAHGLPVVTFFVEPDTGCAPLDVLFSNTTDPGMIGGCRWAFGDGSSSDECQVPHTYVDPGTYSVSLTVTSPAGCDGDTTLYHLVHVDLSPTAAFSFGPQPTDFYHPRITFHDRSSSDVAGWQWTFEQGDPPTSNEQHPEVAFPNDTSGTYPVRLIVSNGFGCTDTLVQQVVIDGVLSAYVPNAFTPNGDGYNDLFMPIVRDALPTGYDLRIFDRWGLEVFHSAQPNTGWDGRVNGQDPVTGVYAWKLRIRSAVDQRSRELNGHVSVLP
ncbi:MAG: PKD domain-containing protein [Flavobacteriales bacterium]